MTPVAKIPRVVLVGGGHAHVQVLRDWAKAGVKANLVLIVDRPDAVYSGMVPGVVAGQYTLNEATIDLRPLAQAVGAQLIVSPVVRVNAEARTLHLQGHPPMVYDFASLNVGSVSAGLDAPGAQAHALATRPIATLALRIDARIKDLRARLGEKPMHFVVVGGGAAGLELAFAVFERYAQKTRDRMCIVDSAPGPLPQSQARVTHTISRALASRGIEFLGNQRVSDVKGDAVVLDNGQSRPADLVLWSTGAAPPPLLGASSLPCDERGFVLTNTALQVKGFPQLFAAGDCAVMEGMEHVPRAGVYAVRAGPILLQNLQASIKGGPLDQFHPQRHFLRIINFCNGRALASRRPLVWQGRLAWALKDYIDRRWIRRFQLPPTT